MLKKLRYKLTFICATMTAAVLMSTLVIIFLITSSQRNERNKHLLNLQLDTLIYSLQNSAANSSEVYVLRHLWLNQLETDNNLIIHIENNHEPLLYSGSYQTPTPREKLIDMATHMATEQYHFNFYIYANDAQTLHSLSFELKLPTHEHYLVSVSSFSIQSANFQIILLKDMRNDDLQALHQLLTYLILFIIGTCTLTLFSYWFAGHAIAPIAASDKKQKEFIAAASHELRSPLAVCQTNLSALALEYPDMTTSPFYTSTQSECKRMAGLINDLLTLSHSDTHTNWSLNLQLIEADTLLLEIYDTFYTEITSKNHQLELQLPNTPVPACLLDGERLTQVLSILISNALCYTPEGTTITLTLSYDAHELCFAVIDNGEGIAGPYKALVFDRFYRMDTSRHQKEHSGLGLSIAHEIAALLGGRLLLSDTLPHGCTFSLFIPIRLPKRGGYRR